MRRMYAPGLVRMLPPHDKAYAMLFGPASKKHFYSVAGQYLQRVSRGSIRLVT
jgi:hypothetical protein